MAEKKKSLGGRILKAFLILLLILLVIAAGAGFYVYKTVNNAGEYADRFNENYEDEMAVYADTPFTIKRNTSSNTKFPPFSSTGI